MRNKKLLSVITLIFLCFNIILPVMCAVADETVYTVSSEKDFVKFAKKCALDTWSQGKTVILEKDLDFSKKSFTPVPTFGGTFDGGGHTISGIKVRKDASNFGLFRYLQRSGLIKDLKIKCDIEITGTKSNIAALVGNNSGTVNGCEADAYIKGGNCVGGIAGVNQASGIINNCSVRGKIYGEHYAGGIAGQNIGQLLLCKNYSGVNTVAEEVKLKLENINFDHLVSTENTADITDVGGIAGYSAGVVQDCINSGKIGYEHIGYNIGGITGRQAGYINGCTNRGKVYGRKDVGGITGQMEPYTVLEYSVSALDGVKGGLNDLQSALDAALEQCSGTKSLIVNRLKSMLGYVDDARSDTDAIIDKSKELVNDGIDSANDLSARVSDMLGSLAPITGTLSDSAQNIKTASGEYKTALDDISKSLDNVDTAELDKAFDSLNGAGDDLKEAAEFLSQGLDVAADSVGDMTKLKRSLRQLAKAAENISSAISDINSAIEKIKAASSALQTDISNGSAIENNSFKELLTALEISLTAIKSSNEDLKYGISKLGEFFEDLPDAVSAVNLTDLSKGLKDAASASEYITSAVDNISAAMDNISTALDKASDTSDALRDSLKDIRTTTDKIKEYADSSVDAISQMTKIFSDFAEQPAITLPSIDDKIIALKDKLSDSIGKITDSMNLLSDDADASGNVLLDKIGNVSDSITGVTDALTNAYENGINKEISDMTEDVSDDDTAQQTNGKVFKSDNNGRVHGDLNVGGIVGSMAIEYDFDPEDDVTKRGDKSLNFVYKTKAVVRSCINHGDISAKKNCVGAICGKEDLGSIIDSLACGTAESTSGSYVGGIVGKSESTVKECYSKCTVKGENYIGGIAGQGCNVYNSLSIAYIEKANEYRGSIAGTVTKAYSGNYFVSETEGGIDSISYTAMAAPVTYEALLSMADTPEEFKSFSIKFYTSGKLYKTLNFNYGETLSEKRVPAVPQKKHLFGKWDTTDFENMTHDLEVYAEYTDYITAIESNKKRADGLSVVVAEGLFGTEAALKMTKETNHAPSHGLQRRELERLHVSMTEDDAKTNVIHYRSPHDAERTLIYVLSDGEWHKVKTKTDGQYILFETAADEFSFSAVKKGIGSRLLLAVCFAALLLLLIGAVLRCIIERRYQKRL